MATDNKFKYTTKDYQAFIRQLIEVTPELSQAYDPQSEQDPVTFILKNIAYVGDILSFYLDNIAHETAPRTMTQRKVANAYYRMMGYYMDWFRPAKSKIRIKNIGKSLIRIPKYTEFISISGDTSAVYLGDDFSIPFRKNDSDEYPSVYIEVYEGTVVSESVGSVYNIVDNAFRLNKSHSSTMMIGSTKVVDTSGSEWTRVEDITKYPQLGKFYDVTADDYDNLFVRFSPFINTTTSNIDYINYLSSKGVGSSILKDSLNKCRIRLPREVRTSDQYANVTPSNVEVTESYLSESATLGYETPEEAYVNSQLYINTTDTLITVVDYKNAIKRIAEISNCVVTDIVTETAINGNRKDITDPISEEIDGSILDGLTYKVRYITGNFNFSVDRAVVEGLIDSKISMLKAVNLQRRLSQDYYILTWQPKGTITLSEAVNQEEADELLSTICKRLSSDYHPSKVDFGSGISLLKLIETIKSYDDRIFLVDLQPIQYTLTKAAMKQGDSSEFDYDVPCVEDLAQLYADYIRGKGLSPYGKRHWTKYNSYSSEGKGEQLGGLRVNSTIFESDKIVSLYTRLDEEVSDPDPNSGGSSDKDDPGKLDEGDEVLDPSNFFHPTHPYRRISIPRFASYKYYNNDIAELSSALNLFKQGISINEENIK